jgi:transposase-like protein
MNRPKRKAAAEPSGTKHETPEIGRFSSQRKMAAVLALLRGEDLDTLSRKLGVTAATLAQWREQFLAGGQANLKSRAPDARDEEILRLRAKIGEITMANELLLDRCHTLEAGRPLAPRRRSA